MKTALLLSDMISLVLPAIDDGRHYIEMPPDEPQLQALPPCLLLKVWAGEKGFIAHPGTRTILLETGRRPEID